MRKKNIADSAQMTTRTKHNILIVQPDQFSRDSLKKLFLLKDSIYSTIEADNYSSAVEIVNNHRNKISLIVMDIIPLLEGLNLLRVLKEIPSIKIIILTHLKEMLLAPFLLKLGINSFLSKNSTGLDELKIAIDTILRDEEYISRPVSIALKKSNEVGGSCLKLTEREFQVLSLLYRGKTNKEVAQSLNLELYTIESYRKNIMLKTSCKNTAELMSFSSTIGI
jgi:DNA-binding NarL/FixJ family response regulator